MKIDVIGWVKGWRLDKFIKKLFQGEFNEEIKKVAGISVVYLQHLKEIANSPELKEVTDSIPGDFDDNIVIGLQEITPVVLDYALQAEGLLDNVLDSKLTFGEKLSLFLKAVAGKTETDKAKQLNGFAVSIAVELAKKLLGIPEGSVINKILVAVPAIFIELFKKK